MPHHDTRRKVTVAADDLRRVTDHLEPMLDPQHRGAPATLGDVAWVAGPLADALGAVLGAVQDLVRAAVSVPEPECASPAVGLTVTGTIYALDGQIPRLSDRGTVSGPADAVAKLLAQFGAQQVEVRPIPDVRIDDRPERHGFTVRKEVPGPPPTAAQIVAEADELSKLLKEARQVGALWALDRVATGDGWAIDRMAALRADIVAGTVTP